MGRLIRYLVCADAEPAAEAAFCSARRHIWDRDEWTGWSKEDLRLRRGDVLMCMSRFCVREGARGCRSLPSMALSALLDAVPADWQSKYGAEVFLAETFVDPSRFEGTCCKASSWINVGETSGR